MKYALLVIFLALKTCSFDSIGTTTSSGLTITNQYPSDIYVEAYSGTELNYYEGSVYGKNLSKEVSIALLTTVPPGDVLNSDLSQETDLIIIIGIDNGSYIMYLTEKVFSTVLQGSSFVVDVAGNIVKQ